MNNTCINTFLSRLEVLEATLILKVDLSNYAAKADLKM